MNTRWLIAGAFASVLGTGIQSATAQSNVVAADWRPSQIGSQERGAPRLVSLNVRRATVAQVLADIQRQSGVGIAGGDDVLNETKRVTLQATKVSPLHAVKMVLQGTSLSAVASSSGTIMVTKKSETAQRQSGTVIGRVIHAKTKQPVAGVTISVDNSDQKVVTAADGTFRVVLDAGEQTVRVRGVGFIRQDKKVVVTADQAMSVEFVLEPSASVLDEVVVTGTIVETERKAIANPITVITGEDLARRGITRVEELMRGEIPGVYVRDLGSVGYSAVGTAVNGTGSVGSDIYVRGPSTLQGTATPLKTFIDGVEMADPRYLGTLDTRNIERIEIVTGPQAATLYGSGAIGGVMQIFTKRAKDDVVRIGLSSKYGVLQSNVSSVKAPVHDHSLTLSGGSGNDFSYSTTLSHRYTGPWQPLIFNSLSAASIGLVYNKGRLSMNGSLGQTWQENGTYRNEGLVESAKLAQGEWVPNADRQIPSQQVAKSSSRTSSLSADFRLKPWWQQHVTIGTSDMVFRLNPKAPTLVTPADTLFAFRSQNANNTTLSGNTTITSRQISMAAFNLSVGGNRNIANTRQTDACKSSMDKTEFIGCFAGTAPWSSETPVTTTWGGFARGQVGLFDAIFFSIGVRAERNPNYGDSHKVDWTPSQGVTTTFEAGGLTVKLLLSYGSATRPPLPEYRQDAYTTSPAFNPSRFISRFGNEDLTPEYSRGPQGGVELYYGNHASLTVNHYQQNVVNLIEHMIVDTFIVLLPGNFEHPVLRDKAVNSATIRQQGWETTGTLNAGPLSFRGTHSWAESRVRSVTDQGMNMHRVGELLKGAPTHTAHLIVGYAHRGTSVNLTMNYNGTNAFSRRPTQYYEYLRGRSAAYNEMGRAYLESFINQPGYTRTNLAALHRIDSWVTVTLHVANLGNSYVSEAARLTPTLGRQTQLGVSMQFPR